jgi:CheY-like chemotaxis protein
LRLLETAPLPDIVLTDLGMPEMTGGAVALAVKRRWPDVSVGLITGWGQEPPVTREERSALDFVLHKPVSFDALRQNLARVRTTARHPEAAECLGGGA